MRGCYSVGWVIILIIHWVSAKESKLYISIVCKYIDASMCINYMYWRVDALLLKHHLLNKSVYQTAQAKLHNDNCIIVEGFQALKTRPYSKGY